MPRIAVTTTRADQPLGLALDADRRASASAAARRRDNSSKLLIGELLTVAIKRGPRHRPTYLLPSVSGANAATRVAAAVSARQSPPPSLVQDFRSSHHHLTRSSRRSREVSIVSTRSVGVGTLILFWNCREAEAKRSR